MKKSGVAAGNASMRPSTPASSRVFAPVPPSSYRQSSEVDNVMVTALPQAATGCDPELLDELIQCILSATFDSSAATKAKEYVQRCRLRQRNLAERGYIESDQASAVEHTDVRDLRLQEAVLLAANPTRSMPFACISRMLQVEVKTWKSKLELAKRQVERLFHWAGHLHHQYVLRLISNPLFDFLYFFSYHEVK
jgi:hypothetical protein